MPPGTRQDQRRGAGVAQVLLVEYQPVGDRVARHRNGEALAGKGLDTPTLRALWVNRQYFHNGQAATLDEVLRKPGHGNAANRPQAERDALTVYLNSLDGTR